MFKQSSVIFQIKKMSQENPDLEVVESFDKYMYRFDDPSINELGYVKISENYIEIFFPEISDSESNKGWKNNHNATLYVNNNKVFDYNWLPMSSINDLAKCKDMLYKCYQEFFP